MKKQVLLSFILSGLMMGPSFADSTSQNVLERDDVQGFIHEFSQKYNTDESELIKWFKNTKIKPEIISAISRPYEALPWYKYRRLFITDSHIESGVAFWNENRETLERAHEKFGVPPEIIVAIIGVETRYGKFKGSHAVLDALTTLAFEYPKRASFFRSELEQFLLLMKEQKLDPTKMMGSYAGAMGFPQFISSSYRRYAIDFSGNGQSDLMNNIEDAIGSVANYFHEHGWQPNQPVAFPAKVKGDVSSIEQSTNNPKPIYKIAELKAKGIEPLVPLKDTNEKAALLTFENQDNEDYWLGLNNFYVITRYNHSHHYAMAVYQLSNKLKEAYQQAKS